MFWYGSDKCLQNGGLALTENILQLKHKKQLAKTCSVATNTFKCITKITEYLRYSAQGV